MGMVDWGVCAVDVSLALVKRTFAFDQQRRVADNVHQARVICSPVFRAQRLVHWRRSLAKGRGL